MAGLQRTIWHWQKQQPVPNRLVLLAPLAAQGADVEQRQAKNAQEGTEWLHLSQFSMPATDSCCFGSLSGSGTWFSPMLFVPFENSILGTSTSFDISLSRITLRYEFRQLGDGPIGFDSIQCRRAITNVDHAPATFARSRRSFLAARPGLGMSERIADVLVQRSDGEGKGN